jgi:hypothetical protein
VKVVVMAKGDAIDDELPLDVVWVEVVATIVGADLKLTSQLRRLEKLHAKEYVD